jgi:hypothetical protein
MIRETMVFLEDLKKFAAAMPAELTEKKGVWTLSFVIAEGKAFWGKKRLQYTARLRIDEQAREILFSERLQESAFGFSAGSGDEGISGGFGFKKEAYRSGRGGREGTLEEQADFFGKRYSFTFDYASIRKKVEALAQRAGYRFLYRITLVS